ncbi:MAG TPA: hypothetical protein VKZ85_16190 [Woeseiaceae bacterium]|nr:hypothetical protein [Woeseiaceae bacterium]
MPLLIDPPVNPFSRSEDILAWLERLAALREEYSDDPDALVQISRHEADAARWLEQALLDEGGANPGS